MEFAHSSILEISDIKLHVTSSTDYLILKTKDSDSNEKIAIIEVNTTFNASTLYDSDFYLPRSNNSIKSIHVSDNALFIYESDGSLTKKQINLIQLDETVDLTFSEADIIQSYPSGTTTHSENYYGYRYSNGYEIKSSIGESILTGDPFLYESSNQPISDLFTSETGSWQWNDSPENFGLWIDFKYPESRSLIKYSISVDGSNWGKSPRAWHIYGSNDGENWQFLDAQGNFDDNVVIADGNEHIFNSDSETVSSVRYGATEWNQIPDPMKKYVHWFDTSKQSKTKLLLWSTSNAEQTFSIDEKYRKKTFMYFKIHFLGTSSENNW